MKLKNLLFLCTALVQLNMEECAQTRDKGGIRRIAVKMGKRIVPFAPSGGPACEPRSCFNCATWFTLLSGRRICCECNCFPATARVSLVNGKSVTMSQLQKGDNVQTVTTDGSVIFSEVRTFLHKQATGVGEYISITTFTNSTINLSREHLIYTRKDISDNIDIIYADQVSIGDEVLIHKNNVLTPAKVVGVSSFMMQGAYVPVTREGNIIVDGVLASCYAFPDHDVAHMGMTPIRLFPQMVEWILGGDENGFPIFVKVADDFNKWVVQFGRL